MIDTEIFPSASQCNGSIGSTPSLRSNTVTLLNRRAYLSIAIILSRGRDAWVGNKGMYTERSMLWTTHHKLAHPPLHPL
eukprot:m.53460 g.53460  ORF g.53460 m.53460 type:complete len:79 (-) comp11366_c0_seq2:1083-1319(-)